MKKNLKNIALVAGLFLSACSFSCTDNRKHAPAEESDVNGKKVDDRDKAFGDTTTMQSDTTRNK